MTKKDNLTLELPNFEGPLDLLLHLIRSQKIDIYDIPIAQITSQYLDYLKKMQQLNLQIAGEYFVMSSALLRIKSQYLLPQNDFVDDDEQAEDPRDELVQQLVQYSVFKKISSFFKEKNEGFVSGTWCISTIDYDELCSTWYCTSKCTEVL